MKVSNIKKVSPEALEAFLAFKRKHGVVKPKKGRGSFSRKAKHKEKYE